MSKAGGGDAAARAPLGYLAAAVALTSLIVAIVLLVTTRNVYAQVGAIAVFYLAMRACAKLTRWNEDLSRSASSGSVSAPSR